MKIAIAGTGILAESIDYAVMKRCPGSEYPIKMVRLDAVWSVLPKDAHENDHVGDVLATDSSYTLVHAAWCPTGRVAKM